MREGFEWSRELCTEALWCIFKYFATDEFEAKEMYPYNGDEGNDGIMNSESRFSDSHIINGVGESVQ